jgi:hypothetical protein
MEINGASPSENRIESRLITDPRIKTNNSNMKKLVEPQSMSNMTSKADESMLKSNYNHREEEERLAISQLQKVADNTLKNEREMLEKLE